jgi:hypothetical protein
MATVTSLAANIRGHHRHSAGVFDTGRWRSAAKIGWCGTGVPLETFQGYAHAFRMPNYKIRVATVVSS